jgi:hypothetical protein
MKISIFAIASSIYPSRCEHTQLAHRRFGSINCNLGTPFRIQSNITGCEKRRISVQVATQWVQREIFKCECLTTYYWRRTDWRQDDSSHCHWTVELKYNHFFINCFSEEFLIITCNKMSDMTPYVLWIEKTSAWTTS